MPIGRVSGFHEKGPGLVASQPPTLVPLTLPGELIQYRILGSGAHRSVGMLEAILEPHPERSAPPCTRLNACGSCDRMMLTYSGQLAEKQARAFAALDGLGGTRQPIVASPLILEYRTRARFVLGGRPGNLVLGAWQSGSHALLDVGDCPVTHPALLAARDHLKAALDATHLPPYDEQSGEGLLRAVVLQTDETGSAVLGLLVCTRTSAHLEPILKRLAETCLQPDLHGGLRGLALNLHPEKGNALTGKVTLPLAGERALTLHLGDVPLTLPVGAFAQVNLGAAGRLYTAAAEIVASTLPLPWKQGEGLLELYCGVGGLGLGVLQRLGAQGLPLPKSLGLEVHAGAIQAARANAARVLDALPAEVRGQAADFAVANFAVADLDGKEALALPFKCACVLVNPPRGGLSEGVRQTLLRERPRCLVYVACGLEALARDLRVLTAGGFRLEGYQPFDLFPQTRQVEVLAWGRF